MFIIIANWTENERTIFSVSVLSMIENGFKENGQILACIKGACVRTETNTWRSFSDWEEEIWFYNAKGITLSYD